MQKCVMLSVVCLLFVVSLSFTPVQSECKAGKVNVNEIIEKYFPYIEKTLPTITLNIKHDKITISKARITSFKRISRTKDSCISRPKPDATNILLPFEVIIYNLTVSANLKYEHWLDTFTGTYQSKYSYIKYRGTISVNLQSPYTLKIKNVKIMSRKLAYENMDFPSIPDLVLSIIKAFMDTESEIIFNKLVKVFLRHEKNSINDEQMVEQLKNALK
ncbi:hypothetical protein TYRP_010054 [Tyrophagus putrescentiae]|nr:hypothetical protein TYRP_010054 [Tyrophagus putrescentiae]